MWHAHRMSKMIQVRNVPDRLHRELMNRARAEGLTLTAYIENLLEREVSKPSAAEVFERVRNSPKTRLSALVAELIREDREGRRT